MRLGSPSGETLDVRGFGASGHSGVFRGIDAYNRKSIVASRNKPGPAQTGEQRSAGDAAELGTVEVAQEENERRAFKQFTDVQHAALFVAQRCLERKPGAGSLSVGNSVRRRRRMGERRKDFQS